MIIVVLAFVMSSNHLRPFLSGLYERLIMDNFIVRILCLQTFLCVLQREKKLRKRKHSILVK